MFFTLWRETDGIILAFSKPITIETLDLTTAMPYTATDMVYNDYLWDSTYANEDYTVYGVPGMTVLDRKQGHEVLYFINRCAFLWRWKEGSMRSCKNLERVIREGVPSFILTHQNIRVFIESRFPTL